VCGYNGQLQRWRLGERQSGYGGGVTIRLKDNGIEPVSFVASWESIEKKDGQLAVANKRAEVWWKFREALDRDPAGRLGNRIASRS